MGRKNVTLFLTFVHMIMTYDNIVPSQQYNKIAFNEYNGKYCCAVNCIIASMELTYRDGMGRSVSVV